jgi:hypothetical protein
LGRFPFPALWVETAPRWKILPELLLLLLLLFLLLVLALAPLQIMMVMLPQS